MENEARIKRLERQQARYEEDIQYLYSIIEKLESQKADSESELQSLKDQLAESHRRLRNSERLCDEKEKFILFRESQLLESEDTIYKLKQRILALSSKMSASSSSIFGQAGPGHRSSGTITELCSKINEDIARIRSLSDSEEINKSLQNILVYQGQISVFADGLESDYAKSRIECKTRIENLEKAVKGYREELEIEREENFHIKDISDERAQEITTLENEIWQLRESLDGARHDIEDKEYGINDLLARIHAIDGERERLQEEVTRALELIGTYTRLVDEYRRNYDELQEVATNSVQADRLNIRRLNRTIAVLKIQNQWRRFRLLNAPLNPPPPVPQPINQVWLLL